MSGFGRRLQRAARAGTSQAGGVVDNSTIVNKFLLGYQGWFQTPNDGSQGATWRHWFSGIPPAGPLVDFWPDVSELTSAERCDTGLTLPNGQPAYLFSDYNQQTVVRHFEWMQDNGLDGVMLQRFCSELSISYMFAERNQVTRNVMAGCAATGRTFNIMYDISGQDAATLVSTIENDWQYLVDTLGVTNDPHYLHQNGKPLVVLWGFGFSDRPGTPADLQALLDFFRNNANPAYRATVMGGVNNDWRTNTTWASTLTGFDVISPWTVGRYKMNSQSDNTSVQDWINKNTVPDLTYANQQGLLYLPVIWPGYSFHNQNSGSALNSYPRYGGNFMWQQAYYSLLAQQNAGMPSMLYGAMFDEMNEGTALFKQATTSASWPSSLTMVPLHSDGYTQLPSDWYLQVSDQVSRMTRGDIPLSLTMPITPS
ncbi:MAG TPA: glycoside hydrolase family 71/99-like protein [Candidatus Saccharimonadales bacterium]|nr:glycoside hydrolase family 71/99-like protein [Candidatus Saccharimonadales bacterium]